MLILEAKLFNRNRDVKAYGADRGQVCKDIMSQYPGCSAGRKVIDQSTDPDRSSWNWKEVVLATTLAAKVGGDPVRSTEFAGGSRKDPRKPCRNLEESHVAMKQDSLSEESDYDEAMSEPKKIDNLEGGFVARFRGGFGGQLCCF